MSILFPASLDTLVNPLPTDSQAVVKHAEQHDDANDAIEALEAKVGVDGSAVATSLDKRLSVVEAGTLKLDQATPQTVISGAPLFNVGLKSGVGSTITFLKGAIGNIAIEDQTGTNQGNGITITAGKGSGSPGYGGQLSLLGGYSAGNVVAGRLFLGAGGAGQVDIIAGQNGVLNIRGADNTSMPGNNAGGDVDIYGGIASGSGAMGTIRIMSYVNASVYAKLSTFALQADRLFDFPDKSGTFAMTSDLGNANLTDTYVGFGGGSGTMTGSDLFTFNTTGNILKIGSVATSEGNKTGELRLANGTTPFYTGFKTSDTTAASVTYVLPTNKPTAVGFMKSDSSGNMSWDTNTYPPMKVTVVTNTYQVLATDYTILCDKTTAFTVTLPAAVVGQILNIKNIGAGTVTVVGSPGTDTIDGITSQTVTTWNNMTVQCYVANKWVIL